jgi:UDP-N-acetylglucosamine/UDP-N-acetylgalactosamine diphosphorylase
MSDPGEQEVLERWKQAGQEQLFAFWEKRSGQRRRRLLEDLGRLDQALVETLQARLREPPRQAPTLEPHPHLSHERWRRDPEALRLGAELLGAGKAAFLTVAGGQGSRLGYEGPKGCFPISPLRRATLFQLLAEKILAAQRRYGRRLPWCIMTSPLNLEDTRSFFRLQEFFGLPAEEVVFFTQGTFPSLDPEGRLLLAPEGGLFQNPDGHGGTIRALREAGLLEAMAARGVEELFYVQVDNPLVRLPDEAFLGTHRLRSSEMSSKVVAKAYPEEKMGVIGTINGRPGVIEYSDLDEKAMHARDDKGELLFSQGSIAIHLLNVGFLRRIDPRLPLHEAHKKAKVWQPGPRGGTVASREAVKFERFIFDAIGQARHPLFCETIREQEFAPLKNRSGVDSVDTCREGMVREHARWLEAAGVRVPRDAEGRPRVAVEISPLYAADPQALKKRLGDTVNRVDEDTLLA